VSVVQSATSTLTPRERAHVQLLPAEAVVATKTDASAIRTQIKFLFTKLIPLECGERFGHADASSKTRLQ